MAKQQAQRKAPPAPAARRTSEKKENIFTAGGKELIFGRQNYLYMGIGLGMVLLGLVLMTGGSMPDPNTWEPERIYSPMRITVAPILMVAGFVVVAIGIFKRKPESNNSDSAA